MSHHSVFDFRDLKEYLSERFSTVGSARGTRIKLSKLINASPSYVSKILSGQIKLNLEHVPVINRILQHSEQEAKYFMNLVLYSQAGSKELEKYFQAEMDAILDRRRIDADWIPKKAEYAEEVQARYFSHWLYVIIHTLTDVPAYQTKGAIAKRLGISINTVTSILDFLCQKKLIAFKDDRYRMTGARNHLSKESPWIERAHINLRQYTIQKMTERTPEDFHYSFVISLSTKDIDIVRGKLQKVLKEIEPLIQDSKSEDVCALSMDFFRI